MLLSSAPDSAATVAKPDLKLWPAKFLFSIPAKFKYSFINKTTDWSVSLLSDKDKPLVNLLNMFFVQKQILFPSCYFQLQ